MFDSRFTQRGLAALLAMTVVALVSAASAGAAPLVLVGNWIGGKSVSVVNSQTHATVGKPIPIGSEVGSIAIVPGGQAFAAEPKKDEVAVINPQTQKLVTTIPVGKGPEYLAVSPDGKTVYVADDGEEAVTIINPATDAVSGTIPVDGEPYGISFSPDGAFAYVTVESEALERIDTATRQVVGEPIGVGEDPITIAFSPDGGTAYVANERSEDISIVDTALNKAIGSIPLPGTRPWGLAMSKDGSRLYVSNDSPGTVLTVSTQTKEVIGAPIPAGGESLEIALTPDGKTLWVAAYASEELIPIDTATSTAGTPIEMSGLSPWQVAVTPDLSPTAIFSPPSVTEGEPATFDGGASVDPDGTVASWSWAFGDGATAAGVTAAHTFAKAGTYNTELSVVDNEGCGTATVLTGRTAYCSGSPLARVVHPVEAKVSPTILCSARFRLGGLVHKRKNGTARLQVKTPGPGSIFLFGKKVHAVTRKATKAGSMWLTIHARVEVNKRLKRTHRERVKVRVTFSPTGTCGSPTTLHTSFALLRAPHKKHRG